MTSSSLIQPQRSASSITSVTGGGRSSSDEEEERLSQLLTSPNFTVSQYLNVALSTTVNTTTTENNISPYSSQQQERQQQLEQRMASLALQLQMVTQSCHDEIGRIGAELQAIVPRCAADVNRLHVGLDGMELDVRGLLEGMNNNDTNKKKENVVMKNSSNNNSADVSAGIGSSNSNNSNSETIDNNNNNNENDPLTTLHTLLNLRTHLSTTKSILVAASSWDETINSIPMLLSTTPPNLLDAVQALLQLERGERALRGMPSGRDDRCATLMKLRTQLEILLKPQLLHALKKMDTRIGPLQQCVLMYDSLGKMDVMREEYVKIRPVELHSLWFSFGGGGSSGSSADAIISDKAKDVTVEVDNEEEEDKEGGEDEDDDEVEDFDFDDDIVNNNDNEDPSTTTTKTQEQQQQQTTARQFMEFIPSFYESTLELLTKERTQSKLVFGPELSPMIVTRVLLEVFKPIVPSFQKRLEKLCPLPGKIGSSSSSLIRGGSSSAVGGTEAIATAYESTLQFLSLAYDQMETWNGGGGGSSSSNQEEGSSRKDNKTKKGTTSQRQQDSEVEGESIQSYIRSAVLLIASPFLPYQRALAVAERDPMGEAASMVAKDVRSVINFEDAAERLGDLAPFMFPLAEAAMNRFELLNSGYNAPATLTSIDKLISNHAAELAIAMGTLSTNASNSSGPEFDEQHVNCALEILRIAGVFKRNLRSFELTTRERLRRLSKEMVDTTYLDDGNNAIDIPDELSPVQVRAIVAKHACDPNPSYIDDGTGVKCPTSVVELQRLAGQPSLFPKSLDATSRLARSCLSLVFEVCTAIPERHLRGISALPVWKQDGGGGSDGADEESYGILPQAFITHVGEHILALVQALEPFASDAEALGQANEVMSGVMDVAVQPWKEFVAAAGCSFTDNEKSQLEILMRGKDLTKYFLDEEDTIDDHDGEQEEEEEDADKKASEEFCNQWLDVVGLAVTGRLLERTMRIPRLSKNGAEHLATDLNYIRNVFTALGVGGHPHPLLGYVAQLVTLDEASLRSKVQLRRGDTEVSEALEVIKRAELRIAYVRGISC